MAALSRVLSYAKHLMRVLAMRLQQVSSAQTREVLSELEIHGDLKQEVQKAQLAEPAVFDLAFQMIVVVFGPYYGVGESCVSPPSTCLNAIAASSSRWTRCMRMSPRWPSLASGMSYWEIW